MTPTLLALSRAYGALQGAPVRDNQDYLPIFVDDGYRIRDRDGLLWVSDPDGPGMVLDLTDAPTGGVLLARFPGHLDVRARVDADGNRMYFGAWRRATDRDDHTLSPSPYLGEAVARAAVALGRAS